MSTPLIAPRINLSCLYLTDRRSVPTALISVGGCLRKRGCSCDLGYRGQVGVIWSPEEETVAVAPAVAQKTLFKPTLDLSRTCLALQAAQVDASFQSVDELQQTIKPFPHSYRSLFCYLFCYSPPKKEKKPSQKEK